MAKSKETIAQEKKWRAEQAARKAKEQARAAARKAHDAKLAQLERDINDLADHTRAPRRGDNDVRVISSPNQLRWLSDAARQIRRVRDSR